MDRNYKILLILIIIIIAVYYFSNKNENAVNVSIETIKTVDTKLKKNIVNLNNSLKKYLSRNNKSLTDLNNFTNQTLFRTYQKPLLDYQLSISNSFNKFVQLTEKELKDINNYNNFITYLFDQQKLIIQIQTDLSKKYQEIIQNRYNISSTNLAIGKYDIYEMDNQRNLNSQQTLQDNIYKSFQITYDRLDPTRLSRLIDIETFDYNINNISESLTEIQRCDCKLTIPSPFIEQIYITQSVQLSLKRLLSLKALYILTTDINKTPSPSQDELNIHQENLTKLVNKFGEYYIPKNPDNIIQSQLITLQKTLDNLKSTPNSQPSA